MRPRFTEFLVMPWCIRQEYKTAQSCPAHCEVGLQKIRRGMGSAGKMLVLFTSAYMLSRDQLVQRNCAMLYIIEKSYA